VDECMGSENLMRPQSSVSGFGDFRANRIEHESNVFPTKFGIIDALCRLRPASRTNFKADFSRPGKILKTVSASVAV